MAERFTGAILARPGSDDGQIPTLGEIGLGQFAPYLMNRVAARWNAGMADALKAHDLSTVMMRALAILSISSSVTINELSTYAVTEQSTMSRTLDALEARGLIRRQPRAGDMRVRDVTITREGRAAFESVWPTMYGLLTRLFEGVADDEYAAFTATLQKMLRNLR